MCRQLVSLLLLGEPGQKNLKQAREAIEGLQLAELDNFFRDACLEVRAEIERVASEVSFKVLLDQDFTTDSIQTALSKTATPVLHLTTHGQFSSSAENTFILT